MNAEARDAAAVRIPPPLVFVAMMFLGLALHRWVWALPLPLPADVLRIATLLAAVLGGGAVLAGLTTLRRSGQDPAPWKPVPELVTGGIFKLSRNPVYVGIALIQVALAFHRANGWMLALVPASLLAVYLTAVRHEEAYMERKFGEEYRRYRQAVRRWL